MTEHILYEGIHLNEPSELTCSCCQTVFIGRWWWTPEDNHFIACYDCAGGFDCLEDWPEYTEPEQLSLWE